SAPKGRLIAPQVQVLRELADHKLLALTTQPATLAAALARLAAPPDLVVADSQAVLEVARIVPPAVPLTTFSLLFARLKGDFSLQLAGALAINDLRPGDPVLLAEACSHHAQKDDIARVKIPKLLEKRAGGRLATAFSSGGEFPDDLKRYKLVLHCGACMLSARDMRRRVKQCAAAGVPVTNYGMAIALCQGVLERAAQPIASREVSGGSA
ncbi:MAG: [FeFe] hydrogenase H-cluster maturation GTPase HydF, partial [Deltaproteobacteria bacterium]|nr:[FeFe] hydrogenase H-cluster maturation GTPase HydF [Deltaproteobacteria bacterium]